MIVGLRRPHTSFVGRAADLIDLAARLERGGLVTLHGPPGVGKTRLAVEHATRCAEAYPGGIWFCDLAGASAAGAWGVPTETGVTEALLRTSGIEVTQGQAALPRLAAALAERGRCLLVLDAFEHLVPDAVHVVATLRDAAQEASLLVTSRTRLRLPGEIVFALQPLPLIGPQGDAAQCDAVQLFEERARAVRRTAADDPASVASLVRALDGLPLAIELAAARARVRTASELLDEVTRAQVLARAGPASGERSQTLDQAIEASWALLPPAQRSVLAQLSVFRGGFTAAAAEDVVSICAGDGSVSEALEELIDRSLLGEAIRASAAPEARFALLASIRDFAARKLAASPSDRAAAEQRHADYYLGAAGHWRREIDTHQGVGARPRIEGEMDNLLAVYRRAIAGGEARAALHAALSIDAALLPRGPHEDRIAMFDGALGLPTGEAEASLVAEAIFARAHAKRVLGRSAEAIEDCEAAAALAERGGDRRLVGRALGAIGLTLWEGGDTAGASSYLARAVPLHAETADRDWMGATLNNRGLIELAEGQLGAARASFEQALRMHRAVGNRRREAMNLNNLACVDAERGLLASALATLAEALQTAHDSGDVRAQATVTLSIGLVHLDAGDAGAAEASTQQALSLAERSRDRLLAAQARTQLAQCLHARGDLDAARGEYGRALGLCRDAQARGLEAVGSSLLAALEASAGRLREAHAALDAAASALEPTRDAGAHQAHSICRVHVQLCEALRGGSPTEVVVARDRAEASLREALEGGPGRSARRWSIQARYAAARLAASSSLAAEAMDGSVSTDDTELLVEAAGKWFRAPGGERVSLHRRRPIGRVLRALVEARLRTPGSTCSPDALLSHGWPDERCDPRSGAARVYNALATLRKLGLRAALLSRDDGYLLDPGQAVRVVCDPIVR